ncbi:MAG: formimidoylglutamase [Bdellovibrio sp.]
MSWFHPVDQHLLFTKNDKEDPRLGECVHRSSDNILQSLNDVDFDFALFGYPDDEGIILNGGRPGAHAAPKEIRTFLYKMTPSLKSSRLPRLFDFGDIYNKQAPLHERHQIARQTIASMASAGKRWISFGGGHDYGYCDGAGFLDAFKDNAVLINFDAHMDVRPTDKGFNSGTPFHRVLSEFSDHVDFAEVGIQNQCNSKSHVEWAKNKSAAIITLDQLNQEGLLSALKNFMYGKENKKVFLSIDIDAFTSSEAPGCSQSWTTGLFTKEFMESLSWLVQHFDVRGIGIYEVSPPLDQDNRTSKLAALIAHQFIFSSLNKV